MSSSARGNRRVPARKHRPTGAHRKKRVIPRGHLAVTAVLAGAVAIVGQPAAGSGAPTDGGAVSDILRVAYSTGASDVYPTLIPPRVVNADLRTEARKLDGALQSRKADAMRQQLVEHQRIATERQRLAAEAEQRRLADEAAAKESAAKEAAAKEIAAKEAAAKRTTVKKVVTPKVVSGFVKPTEGRLTSGFGGRWGTTHYGIDIANRIGTPIVSVAAGTVIEAGPASGFGLWVRVRHDDGTVTVYGHVNEIIARTGTRVTAGQLIATIGNRGQSTGPHLHFEVWTGGSRKVDPLSWLRARGIGI
ncbi:MAG: M23 family metallopeptidase [Actinomycetota bacterium]|nr:M23 family metallopeptidase [Actinomycetota bacterium]